jgi:hypothetical protein
VHRRYLASSTAPPARLSPAVCPLPRRRPSLICRAPLPPHAPVYLPRSNCRCGAVLLPLLLQRDTREVDVRPPDPPARRRAFRTVWRCYVRPCGVHGGLAARRRVSSAARRCHAPFACGACVHSKATCAWACGEATYSIGLCGNATCGGATCARPYSEAKSAQPRATRTILTEGGLLTHTYAPLRAWTLHRTPMPAIRSEGAARGARPGRRTGGACGPAPSPAG